MLVDFALISASFVIAYLVRMQGEGSVWQRHVLHLTLPAVLVARYIAFIVFGLYRGVWRYFGARDAGMVFGAVLVSEAAAFLFIWATVPWDGFPRGTFFIDLLLCTMLISLARFWERGVQHAVALLVGRGKQRRTLIVGAGRTGRSMLRELRETPGERVVGFVDDDPAIRRRRIQGVEVMGRLDEIGLVLGRVAPDAVLVTIPEATKERLDGVVEACNRAGVPCGFIRREIDHRLPVMLGAATK